MIFSSRSDFSNRCRIHEDTKLHYAHYKDWLLDSVFQPIFDQSNDVIGYEALLRITCAINGNPIPPSDIFALDSISNEDKINVDQLSQAVHIRNFAQTEQSHLKLFLNTLPISNEHRVNALKNNSLLLTRLNELDLKPDQLVQEIIESESTDDIALSIAVRELKDNGFHVAIDDFGSLSSNLQRVALIKPNVLKIDRGLLLAYMSGDKQPLYDTLLLGNSLHAPTVIEGIETSEQLEEMAKLNIEFYQGFYLAKPTPLAKANAHS
ncbi:EAL domain-containing protein [Vibrio tapetis]|uniref:EAL domain-containing protein n=1 Tax=Vibrio tapetis subsp. tapetis TaxID=1671868 RepID=A0A2N8ZNE8_9VIBR|nr:EAL domain-containing protein [Vibrio tapetis]SON53379.1 conserved protein of unknown function [Vibrio tapetis subsp. tapetis]